MNDHHPECLRRALEAGQLDAPMAVTVAQYADDLDRALLIGRQKGLLDALFVSAAAIAVVIFAFGLVWLIAAEVR